MFKTKTQLIGPFFFEEDTIRQDKILDKLKNYGVFPVENWQPNMIFKFTHWGLDVCAFLNAEFTNRWIGRDGPTTWPPRSPE